MTCSEIAGLAPLYRSGELDRVRTAAFDAHIEDCPQCASEMRDEKRLDDLLRAGVLADTISAAPLDRRVREQIDAELADPARVGPPRAAPSVPQRPRWRVAAIGAVAALLLFAVGYRHLSQTHSVYADAATDHRHEVVDAHWRPWLTDTTAIAALAERSGVDSRAILALAPPGYRLARAKRCALAGRPFLHLVYSNGAEEFSAYLRPRDAQPLAELAGAASATASGVTVYTKDFGPEHVGCVQTGGVTAMIVTDESAAAASDLTRLAGVALASSPRNF